MVENALDLAHTTVDTLEQKKGDDILLLDLSEVSMITDLFVICTGRSERTLKALATEVQRRIKSAHAARPLQVEGDASSGWVLIDYGPVIVHLFSPTLRDYYSLEELWKDGRVLLRIA